MSAKHPRRSKRNPNEPLRAVIVTRLSQAGRDDVPHETQEAGCRRRVEALGGVVVAVFQDTISRDRYDRTGLASAVELIQAGRANRLVTYSVDRLGADIGEQFNVLKAVRLAGGEYVSATQEVGSGWTGDLLIALLTAVANGEVQNTRERVNRALDARFAQQRRYKPAKRPPYGYARVADGAYAEDPAEAAVVRRIFAEAAAGVSRRKIAARLNGDGVPTPTGNGQWGTTTVVTILARACYWTGRHEVWRSRVVRGEGNVPYREARPPEERYHVPFPPLIDPALAERARAAAARNTWNSARSDRSPTVGVLRYGLAVCGTCGRALSLVAPKRGGERYACTHHRHDRPKCDAPVSLTRRRLDDAVVAWVEAVALDPVRAASRWVEVEERPEADAALLARLAAAEMTVAGLTGRVAGLVANLGMLTGEAARIAADQINALNVGLAEATDERDRVAAEAALATPPRRATRRVSPETAIAGAVEDALRAGWGAYRRWFEAAWGEAWAEHADLLLGEPEALEDGVRRATDGVLLPRHDTAPGWHAWQAALSTLGVTVVVNQVAADEPRWVARMRLPGGDVGGTCTHQPRC